MRARARRYISKQLCRRLVWLVAGEYWISLAGGWRGAKKMGSWRSPGGCAVAIETFSIRRNLQAALADSVAALCDKRRHGDLGGCDACGGEQSLLFLDAAKYVLFLLSCVALCETNVEEP